MMMAWLVSAARLVSPLVASLLSCFSAPASALGLGLDCFDLGFFLLLANDLFWAEMIPKSKVPRAVLLV